MIITFLSEKEALGLKVSGGWAKAIIPSQIPLSKTHKQRQKMFPPSASQQQPPPPPATPKRTKMLLRTSRPVTSEPECPLPTIRHFRFCSSGFSVYFENHLFYHPSVTVPSTFLTTSVLRRGKKCSRPLVFHKT